MYLLLYTQGLALEIGTKFDEYQITPGMGDVIQTDMRLQKGLDTWCAKNSIDISNEVFDFSTALMIAKSLAARYSVGYGQSGFDDLYNVGLEGITKAYLSWDTEKDNSLKAYVGTCIRNAIFGELRKVKRWNNEISFSYMDKEDECGDSFDTLPFSEGVSSNEDTEHNPMWMETTTNQEDKVIATQQTELARQRVAALVTVLNERETYVLWNHIVADEPETMRDIAKQFKCSKDSILRDTKRVNVMLRLED